MTGTDFFSIKIFFITMRCSTLRGTFCSLITLATPRQDWTGSNPSRREGGGCGFTLSRLHSCCAVRLVYTQISPGHIWTTLYVRFKHSCHLCQVILFFNAQVTHFMSHTIFFRKSLWLNEHTHSQEGRASIKNYTFFLILWKVLMSRAVAY